MPNGDVISIHIAPKESAPMETVEEVRAVPGRGLQGDRYYLGVGAFSHKPSPKREITLIEGESLEALQRDYQIELKPDETRRNIVTRGVALNHLVSKEFTVGSVRLRGIELCEPCSYLESLTKPGVKQGLIHRGGLRAQILTEGIIRVGDAITDGAV